MKVVNHRNRLLREVVESPFLEVFQTQLHATFCKVLQLTLL